MLKSLAIFVVTVLMLTLFSACKSNESAQLLSDNSSEVQSAKSESSDTVDSVSSDYVESDKATTNNTTSSNKNTNRPTVPSITVTPSDKNSGTTSNQATNSSQSSSEQSTEDKKPNEENKNPTEENKNPIEGLSLSEQYFWYNNLTAQEQYNFMQTFPSVPDFVNWHNGAEAAYKAEHPEIELGPDSIVGNSK